MMFKKNLFLICLCSIFYLNGIAQIIAEDSLQIETPVSNTQINNLSTQKIKIQGKVIDFTTAEPLSFATISILHTAIGVRADVDGNFTIWVSKNQIDTLRCSSIGYIKKDIVLDTSQTTQHYTIELERSTIQIKELVIRFDRNPGLTLMKKVIQQKDKHNADKADNYSYEVYNKIEIDINKIPKKAFKQSPLLKKFDFVQQYIDSSSEDKPFLPLFLTETISDYYFQKKPKRMQEVIKGSRISGYKNESVSKLLGSMYQNINIYKNSIPVFNIDFVSPIADDAPFFYHYAITDTQIIQHKTFYHVTFYPKRKGEHTFTGDCWVHDTDYAVSKINMVITKQENINWINKVTMLQEFSHIADTLWFLTKDKFYVDFLPPHGDKIAGFLGRKTTSYRNITFNHPIVDSIFNTHNNKIATHIENNATVQNESYWNEHRHDSLSKNEKAIYHMIDTIQNLPFYNKYYKTLYFLTTGYVEVGPIELGSFYSTYSSNPVEGARYKFTIGTTPALFKKIYLRAHIAYGTKDNRYKYNASGLWILRKNPRMYVYSEIKSDIENNTNIYDQTRSIDNVFSRIGRKQGIPWKLAFVDKQRLEFFNSLHNGLSYQLSMERKKFSPYQPLPASQIFLYHQSPSSFTQTTEIGCELKYAYKEEFIEGNYYRTSLGTKYPIVKLYTGIGLQGILDGQYAYVKTRLTISDWQSLKRYGQINYYVFAGKIWGTLPYNLLEVHPGNEFHYYNTNSFNMMYRYEFISDQFAGLFFEHNVGGLFTKYIPYVNKLKMRFFWNTKAVVGNLRDANKSLNLNKGYVFETLHQQPYIEAGTGIENILKVLRIDFVWRILPRQTLQDSELRRFGVMGSLHFAF